MSANDLEERPLGWKSRAAKRAENYGLVDAFEMARQLHVPVEFVVQFAPEHEWHHVRKHDRIGRRSYYDPRCTVIWFEGNRGQEAVKRWQKVVQAEHGLCVLPNRMKTEIKAASRNNLILCFAGVGSAWAKKNANTSLIIAKNEKMLLVDMGRNIPDALAAKGINTFDFDAYHFTHSHADHIGGVEDLFLQSRYMAKKKPNVIITENYQRELWEFSLKGGCEYNETGLLRFSDFVQPLRPHWIKDRPREMYRYTWEGVELIIFRTIHIPGDVAIWESAYWSTGLVIDGRIIFTADTRFDPTIFNDLAPIMKGPAEAIFHDCQLAGPGSVHATYEELKTLPGDMKKITRLTHFGDGFDKVNPVDDGFAGYAEAWKLYAY